MAISFPLGLSLLATAALTTACSDKEPAGNDDPSPPSDVTVTAVSAVAARVAFTAVAGATGYIVERAPGAAGGTFTQVGSPTAPPFDDAGLEPEATYRYRVITVSGSRQSDPSVERSITLPSTTLTVVDADITTSTTWTADKRYRLTGFIHVVPPATLTIEEGTVIEGDFNTVGSSLFILRGAKIDAVGTAANPIVFTSSQPAGQRRAGDWGGLIIIGNGIINRTGSVTLEGTNTSEDNPPQDYGNGTDNADDSGRLKYVRIEFAGYATATDAELNSLTLAAVGSGTEIEYVQTLNGLDDSFEFFGGAVDAKHLVSYNAGDDHFDMSEGYVGRLQHLIGFQQIDVGTITRPAAGNESTDPQGIENDGCQGANCGAGQNSEPRTVPLVANFTLVGPPGDVNGETSGTVGMMLRRGTGGYYVNGLLARWNRAGISLRDQTTLDRVADESLILRNILVAETENLFQTGGSSVQGTVDATANAIEHVAATTATSLFAGLPGEVSTAALDWTPSAAAASRTGGLVTLPGPIATKAGTFMTGTAYRGAADPNGAKWWQGWTRYAEN